MLHLVSCNLESSKTEFSSKLVIYTSNTLGKQIELLPVYLRNRVVIQKIEIAEDYGRRRDRGCQRRDRVTECKEQATDTTEALSAGAVETVEVGVETERSDNERRLDAYVTQEWEGGVMT